MMPILALLEGAAIVLALSTATFAWHRPVTQEWALGIVKPALWLGLGALATLYYGDAYDWRTTSSVKRFAARLPRCLALGSVPLAASYALFPGTRSIVLAGLLVIPAVLILLRALFYRLAQSRSFAERVLVIGTGALACRAVEAVEEESDRRSVVVAVVGEPVEPGDPLARYPRLGPLVRLADIIQWSRPHRIVVALQERRRTLPCLPLIEARLSGIVVEDGAQLYERLTGKIAIEALVPSSVIFSRDFRPRRGAAIAGRLLSLAVASVGLIASAPLLAVIAAAIRLDSAGPVLFVQERVGRWGRRFQLVKFRTMHVTDVPPSEWAGDNRDRITRIGHWLRRFRLDELPQFVNVLRGDMELVGPRPHPASNFSAFVTVLRNSPECGEQIPYYSLRSMVRPGITGWAQVRYRYANNLEEEIEKMRYDLFYVKHRSLWLDLRILADTVKTVVAGRESVEDRPGAAALPPRSRWQFAERAR